MMQPDPQVRRVLCLRLREAEILYPSLERERRVEKNDPLRKDMCVGMVKILFPFCAGDMPRRYIQHALADLRQADPWHPTVIFGGPGPPYYCTKPCLITYLGVVG